MQRTNIKWKFHSFWLDRASFLLLQISTFSKLTKIRARKATEKANKLGKRWEDRYQLNFWFVWRCLHFCSSLRCDWKGDFKFLFPLSLLNTLSFWVPFNRERTINFDVLANTFTFLLVKYSVLCVLLCYAMRLSHWFVSRNSNERFVTLTRIDQK